MVILRQLCFMWSLNIAFGQEFSFQDDLAVNGTLQILTSEGGKIALSLISVEYLCPIQTEYQFFRSNLSLKCRCQCSSRDLCPESGCPLCFPLMGIGYNCETEHGFQVLNHHNLCCEAEIIPGNQSYHALFLGESRRILKLQLTFNNNSREVLTNITFHMANQNEAIFHEVGLQFAVSVVEGPKLVLPTTQVAILGHDDSNLTFLPSEAINKPWEWNAGKLGWLRKVGGTLKFPDLPEMFEHIHIPPHNCRSLKLNASFESNEFQTWEKYDLRWPRFRGSWLVDRKLNSVLSRPDSPKPLHVRLAIRNMSGNSTVRFEKMEDVSTSETQVLTHVRLEYFHPNQLMVFGKLSWRVRSLIADLDDGHLR